MAFGFESGITSFFERRKQFFNEIDINGSYQERIQSLKSKMKVQSNNKPTVVILGAGPAGLLRAIQSISNGNPTRVIEKRSEDASGRINTVALTETTIAMLQYCGIYQYLRENRLIYPPNRGGYISVRLTDLERAMKEVLKELSPDSIIQYDSQVSKVASQSDKIQIVVESTKGVKQTLSNIDILVNAEGSRSSTNSLLGIGRKEVLPSIPVIAAVYTDNRPKIRGIVSLLKYTGKTVLYIAKTIHYHVQFLFKFILSKNFRTQITGALILKTPQQNYVGCGFSDKINEQLSSLKQAVEDEKAALKNALSDKEIKKCERKLKIAEDRYHSFAKRWINNSICFANLLAIIERLHGSFHLCTGIHLSFDRFELIKIGADHANEYCRSINQSAVLLTGDASATVDPTTGLGCNTAIQSSVDFLDYIWDYDAKVPQKKLLQDYTSRITNRIAQIHRESKLARSQYRPDALVPRSMFMNMIQSVRV